MRLILSSVQVVGLQARDSAPADHQSLGNDSTATKGGVHDYVLEDSVTVGQSSRVALGRVRARARVCMCAVVHVYACARAFMCGRVCMRGVPVGLFQLIPIDA